MKQSRVSASGTGDRGFTLIELLVVITILVVVFGVTLASFNTFNKRQRLIQAALNLKAALRYAQTRAIAVDKPASGCTTFEGMHIAFTGNTYTVTHECSGNAELSPELTKLPDGVTFSTTPTAFTFRALNRTTDLASDLTITLTNVTQAYRLQVTTNGQINDVGF